MEQLQSLESWFLALPKHPNFRESEGFYWKLYRGTAIGADSIKKRSNLVWNNDNIADIDQSWEWLKDRLMEEWNVGVRSFTIYMSPDAKYTDNTNPNKTIKMPSKSASPSVVQQKQEFQIGSILQQNYQMQIGMMQQFQQIQQENALQVKEMKHQLEMQKRDFREKEMKREFEEQLAEKEAGLSGFEDKLERFIEIAGQGIEKWGLLKNVQNIGKSPAQPAQVAIASVQGETPVDDGFDTKAWLSLGRELQAIYPEKYLVIGGSLIHWIKNNPKQAEMVLANILKPQGNE